MPYVQVPKSGQTLGQTRDQIRENIQALNASLELNHVGLDQGAQTGKHKFVEMPNQGSAPTTIAGESSIYSKVGTSGSQLYLIRDAVAGTETQLTTAAITAPTVATNGVTWLPGVASVGCLLYQWGRITGPGATTGSVVFPTPFRAATPPYSVTFGYAVTSGTNAHAIWINDPASLTHLGFNWKTDVVFAGTAFWCWMAIGLAPT